MNTFFYEALKVLDEENKNGGWEGKENGLLPLKSIQSSNRITTTRSFVQVIQGLLFDVPDAYYILSFDRFHYLGFR